MLVEKASLSLICAGFLPEILNRRRVAAALEAGESPYRPIVRWLPGGMRTWVHEPCCRAYGLTQEEAIGTSFFLLISATDADRVQGE